jgi:hypothetical protein
MDSGSSRNYTGCTVSADYDLGRYFPPIFEFDNNLLGTWFYINNATTSSNLHSGLLSEPN